MTQNIDDQFLEAQIRRTLDARVAAVAAGEIPDGFIDELDEDTYLVELDCQLFTVAADYWGEVWPHGAPRTVDSLLDDLTREHPCDADSPAAAKLIRRVDPAAEKLPRSVWRVTVGGQTAEISTDSPDDRGGFLWFYHLLGTADQPALDRVLTTLNANSALQAHRWAGPKQATYLLEHLLGVDDVHIYPYGESSWRDTDSLAEALVVLPDGEKHYVCGDSTGQPWYWRSTPLVAATVDDLAALVESTVVPGLVIPALDPEAEELSTDRWRVTVGGETAVIEPDPSRGYKWGRSQR